MGLSELERARLIEAEWDKKILNGSSDETYLAEINIYANNRSGLLVDISKVFTEAGIDIRSINSKASKQDVMTVTMGFEIHNTAELEGTVNKLRRIESIIDIERASG
jgi:GTP pyrophosphokinase